MLERLLTYLWFALLLITSIASDESRKKVLIAVYSIMLDSIKKEDALDFIVDKAIEYKLGARGLRSIMETIMIEAQFSAPSNGEKMLTITREYAEQQIKKSEKLK